MVMAAKKSDEREPMKALHFDAPQRDSDLADEIIAARADRTGARHSRNNIMREALRRGLLAMADEEGVRTKR